MAGLIEKSLLAGLGVMVLTRDKVKEFVDKLVEEGEVKPEEAPSIVDKLGTRGEEEREELRKLVRQELDKARANVPVISRKDVEALSQKIDELTAKVEELAGKKAPADYVRMRGCDRPGLRMDAAGKKEPGGCKGARLGFDAPINQPPQAPCLDIIKNKNTGIQWRERIKILLVGDYVVWTTWVSVAVCSGSD